MCDVFLVMKFVVASILILALGDFAINHGDGVGYCIATLGEFWHWLGNSVEGSLWTW